MQKRIMISQNEFQKLKQFKQFNDVSEMNKHINAHCKNPSLNRNERQFLKLLSQYSTFENHTGVSWRKVSELANELELSERSISRYIAKLVDLRVIQVVETYTLTKSRRAKQGANIYIILPCEVVKSEEKQGDDRKANLIKTEKQSNTNKAIRKEKPKIEQLDESFVPNHIPKEYVRVAKGFFCASDIFKSWGKVLLAAKHSNITSPNDYIKTIISTFKQSIFMLKSNRIKKDFMGYFYSGLLSVFVTEKRRERAENFTGTTSMSWLEVSA
jgi:DNA-binding Lrp family transcriptional regulator